ncbi:helix-turn-helix domain-containing protein [Micromonospora sp. NPDC049559]|uniref:winged helix-turn-helix transcriptional regulator n=1 Tax=Micromonospora sp. NPDC049559 TaxID=3155923 RepID=UPI003442610F
MKVRQYVCGLDAAVDIIGGKWKVLIIWTLAPQPRRFGELRRLVPGISEKVLIQHLREMEANEIVRRQMFDEVPARVEYSLTPLGASLNDALAPLADWGATHMQRTETAGTCAYAPSGELSRSAS